MGDELKYLAEELTKHDVVRIGWRSLSDSDVDAFTSRWNAPSDLLEAKFKKSSKRRLEFALGRALLRSLLSEVLGEKEVLLIPDGRGKLSTAGAKISLTHSHDVVAAAVSLTREIGIDVERWCPRNFAQIAAYAFGPRERIEVEQEGEAAFYRIWTLREAQAKATGEGFSKIIDGVDCADGIRKGWQNRLKSALFYGEPETGYSLAIATIHEL